jgi:CoA:oxalate CoA-transferase
MSWAGTDGEGHSRGLLAGLRVVELAGSVSVAHCGRLLADHGAQVIVVEGARPLALRSRGPHAGRASEVGDSALFATLSCSKQGMALDYRTEAGRDLLRRLVERADVVVHGLAPAEAAAAGLALDQLADDHQLTCVAITPFGQTGPYRDYLGDDLICCAAGNISFGIGARAGRPLKLPLSLASYEAGAMGFLAVMSAGVGRANQALDGPALVDVSTVDVLASLFSTGITAYPYRGVVGRRNGNHGTALYPDVFLPCADGFVGIVCNQLQQWIRLLDLMGNPSWVENPRYRDRRRMTEEYPEEVDALLVPWLTERTREEIFDLCRARDVPVAPSYTIAELLAHPHLVDRAAFREFEVAGGEQVLVPGWPAVFSSIETVPWRRGPRFGEHTEQILTDLLGVSESEQEVLYAAQVVS